jgi:putative ABC transport system ATP-binding protein
MNAPQAVQPGQVVLSGRGLAKSFRSGRIDTPILRGLSLEVLAGELTLVSGPSGCGKSTLLALLSGLSRPDGGQVEALGQSLWSLDEPSLERFRLQHTGFVFQGFNLFAALDAVEQVMLPLGALGLSRASARERALAALDEVGLAPRAKLRPAEMSGGEKQRVAIARALAKNPQLLFADEPTGSLDAATGQRVIDLLFELNREYETTLILVTHDERVAHRCSRQIAIDAGRIIEDRPQERVG